MEKSLIECLGEAIDIQQKKQDRDFSEMMQKPLSERVAKGHTLVNLSIEIIFYSDCPNPYCPRLAAPNKYIDTVIIKCQDNCSKFREGATVMLSHGDIKYQMIIDKDGINEMILKSDDFNVRNNVLNSILYPIEGWELNEVNLTINQRLLSAARQTISSNSSLCNNLAQLFAGSFQNRYTGVTVEMTDNRSQDIAVAKSIGCSYFHLIQGPPGTGKTYTIARIVQFLTRQNKRILVTGPTHTAINNCLNAISEQIQSVTLVKIGEKAQATEILKNNSIIRKQRLPYHDGLDTNGIVIGSTPYALCYPAAKKLQNWYFDYVLIDEAAQMSIPLALAAMAYGSKIILVGDHKQLDPIVPTGTGNWLFSKSVFKHLIDLYPNYSTMLDISYRLSPSLVKIPSTLFYGGNLSSNTPDVKSYEHFCCTDASDIINHHSNEVLFIHHEFDGLGRCPFEANICAGIVSDLIDNNVSIDDIALITPYRAQVREIKRALVERFILNEDELEGLFIDTIDRMQGQEKDYVVFSLSNSNPAAVEDRLEFFYSANRLNVAITRARIKCIILANEKVFQLCNPQDVYFSTNEALNVGRDAYWRYYKMATIVRAEDTDDEW